MGGHKEVLMLFHGIKRLFVLLAVVLVQSCLGGLYAWSAFAPELQRAFGYTAGQTQLIFGLSIATFTLSMVLAGRLLSHWGSRSVALFGGLLFAGGHILSAASGGEYLWLVLGSGLLVGASIGFGYVAALTTGIQWFPTHKGLVAGVAVAGFGAGAIILSSLANTLLLKGFSILELFRSIGLGYGAVVCFGALFLFRPPSLSVQHRDVCLKELLKDRVFLRLLTGTFCGTFAGLLVIGNLKSIAIDGGATAGMATAAISFFAVGNASGRLAWGWLFDRFGDPVVPVSLLFLGTTLALLLLVRHEATAFSVCALLIGFGFGACFVVYAAQVALHYGAEHVPSIYPLVFLAYGVAGITGPTLGGLLCDYTGSYLWALVVGIAVLMLGVWSTSRISDLPERIDSP